MAKHTFVICAYKESPYLEECIRSILSQTVSSEVMITTSTRCTYIDNIAEKYNIPVLENKGESGIAGDWNFAYRSAKTEYVTIAHQDDWYCPSYTERTVNILEKSNNPIIAFSNYGEIRNGEKIDDNMLLRIKRILLKPMKSRRLSCVRSVKRMCLSFGNPVCCPSVTYVKKRLPVTPFERGFQSNLDWALLEKVSKYYGSFCYVTEISMYHRIHQDSTTSMIIGENKRGPEDYDMFCRFWPKPIAAVIARIYGCSQFSNSLKS